MSLKQAVSVIMGANIGTTITAWIVAVVGKFKITNYALPAIGFGLLLNMAGKRQKKHWGSVVLGFGLLLLGLAVMKEAFGPLGDSEPMRKITEQFARNPLTGVLVGMLTTMVVQSSSATIGIAQLLALQGVLTFDQALPLILGDNIGTTITAQIASVGTNVNAKRAARAHMLFNLLGVCVILPFVWTGAYGRFVEFIVPGELTGDSVTFHIAISHTVFNMACTLLFMPAAGLLAAAARRLVPGEAGVVPVEPQYLEERLLDNPPIALEQARREVVRMIELAASAVRGAGNAFFTDDARELALAAQKEDAIDNLQNKITQYLIKVSRHDLGLVESNELPVLLHSVNDIERIGDHAVNLAEAAARKIEERMPFSDAAMEELSMMRDEVDRMFAVVIESLSDSDAEMAKRAFESEDRLNVMEREFRQNHLVRLQGGDCHFNSGLTFVDCIYNYEKIGDHLMNTAQAVLGDFQWGEKIKANGSQPAEPLPAD
jgi:phosphate:Na+ symporter